MKTIEAIILHRMLREASYGKTTGAAKIIFIRNSIALRPVAERFEADYKAALEQLAPPDFAELEAKVGSPDATDTDREAYAQAYRERSAAADEALRPMLEADADVTLTTLPEEDVAAFLDSNAQLGMEQMELALTMLAAPKEEEKPEENPG